MAEILVVDDDSNVRSLVRKTLEVAGHTVAEAAHGTAALRYLERHHPDAILTDLFMPEMDGLELARAVRRMDYPPPIVGMTGSSDQHVMEMAERLGARQVLTKPFDPLQVLAALKAVLD